VPTAAVVLFAGDVEPMSTESSTPRGKELVRASAVTTARPLLFVPRSGSTAIAIGAVSTPIEIALNVVGGVVAGVVTGGKSKPRLISDTVFCCVFATSAAPVPSLIATPIGPLPVVTSGTACFLLTMSRIDAYRPPLFATNGQAKPRTDSNARRTTASVRLKKVPNPAVPALFGGLSTNPVKLPALSNVGS